MIGIFEHSFLFKIPTYMCPKLESKIKIKAYPRTLVYRHYQISTPLTHKEPPQELPNAPPNMDHRHQHPPSRPSMATGPRTHKTLLVPETTLPRYPTSHLYIQESLSPNPRQRPGSPLLDRTDLRPFQMPQLVGQNQDPQTWLNAPSPTYHLHHAPSHPYIAASP